MTGAEWVILLAVLLAGYVGYRCGYGAARADSVIEIARLKARELQDRERHDRLAREIEDGLTQFNATTRGGGGDVVQFPSRDRGGAA